MVVTHAVVSLSVFAINRRTCLGYADEPTTKRPRNRSTGILLIPIMEPDDGADDELDAIAGENVCGHYLLDGYLCGLVVQHGSL